MNNPKKQHGGMALRVNLTEVGWGIWGQYVKDRDWGKGEGEENLL